MTRTAFHLRRAVSSALMVLGLLVVLGASSAAEAYERILSFVSDVTVNPDASLTVRETIAVNAEGNQIRRGIFRDFPTTYTDRHGVRVRVGFEVLSVRRDGHDEPYATEWISNGIRVRIGDKDVFLDSGQHVYEISYRTTRQIGFFEAFDEIYWNVTGNGWMFEIEQARVTIRLPTGARITQHAEYTGPQGSTANEARVLDDSGSHYAAETTRPLLPGDGFTVAVAFPKGLVEPPGAADTWGWWIADNAGYAMLGLSLLISLAYFLFAWNKVGRDPPKGVIVPLFSPPDGMGPAGVRYVSQYGFDDRTFAAAVVGLAVKGRLKIADDDDAFTLTRQSHAADKARPLTAAEQALYLALPNGSLTLKQSNHAKVRAAKTALQKSLDQEYDGKVFLRNWIWFGIGLAISVACLLLAAILLPDGEGLGGIMAIGFLTVWWGVILSFGWGAVSGAIHRRGILNKIGSLGMLLFLIPFVGGGVVMPAGFALSGALTPTLILMAAAAIALGAMNVLFFYLLRAPTEPGRKLMDQIEGFKLYLSTAEEDRLNVLNPPEKTPELFERYLPYALALDCENEWNAKFTAVLAAAAVAGASAPSWYSGSHWDAGRSGSFTDSLGSSLASSISSSSSAPGSSSGSGGGGSSGGGGGGGGGGGW
jgi:uncharacterized membrane protein YgcG